MEMKPKLGKAFQKEPYNMLHEFDVVRLAAIQFRHCGEKPWIVSPFLTITIRIHA